MRCTFSCAQEHKLAEALEWCLFSCRCNPVSLSSVFFLNLCLEERKKTVWIVGNAFDLHVYYKNPTLQENDIFPLKHSRCEQLHTKTSVSSDHDSDDYTALHRVVVPALILIYWATLFKWVTVSLGWLLAPIVHYSSYCYWCLWMSCLNPYVKPRELLHGCRSLENGGCDFSKRQMCQNWQVNDSIWPIYILHADAGFDRCSFFFERLIFMYWMCQQLIFVPMSNILSSAQSVVFVYPIFLSFEHF